MRASRFSSTNVSLGIAVKTCFRRSTDSNMEQNRVEHRVYRIYSKSIKRLQSDLPSRASDKSKSSGKKKKTVQLVAKN